MSIINKAILNSLLLTALVAIGTNAHAADDTGNLKGEPFTLEEAYSSTLKNNSVIRIAREKLRRADISADKAYTYLLPEITASYTYVYFSEEQILPFFNFAESTYMIQNNPDGTSNLLPVVPKFEDIVFQPQQMQVYSLEINQPILAGPAYPAIQITKEAKKIQDEALRLTKANILYAVTLLYNGALVARDYVRINRDSVKSLSTHLELAQTKFRLGNLTKLGVMQAEYGLAAAREKLSEAEDMYLSAMENLMILTGKTEQDKTTVALVDLDPPKRPEVERSEMEDIAIDNRSEMKIAKMAMTIAEKLKDISLTAFAPFIGAQFKYDYNPDPGDLGQKESWRLALVASLKIFQGGQRFFDVSEKQSAVDEAKITINSVRDQVVLAVREAYRKLQTSDMSLTSKGKLEQLATAAFLLTTLSFEQGLVTSQDVVDANISLLSARLLLVDEKARNNSGVFSLKLALGMLPEDLGIEEPEEPQDYQEPIADLKDYGLKNAIPLPATEPVSIGEEK